MGEAAEIVAMEVSLCDQRGAPDEPLGVSGGFVFLCREDRRGLYEAYLAGWDKTPVRFFSGVDELLIGCLMEPPLAVMVDMPTQISVGSKNVTYLYDLRMWWPVMRCKDTPDGSFNVMCQRPIQMDTLLTAMEHMYGGDPTWLGIAGLRKHMRAEFFCRARYRVAGQAWRLSNVLNISMAGVFLVSYEALDVDGVLEVELLDVASEPIRFSGVVSHHRDWEEGSTLPGFGVSVSNRLSRERLAEVIVSKRLLSTLNTRK